MEWKQCINTCLMGLCIALAQPFFGVAAQGDEVPAPKANQERGITLIQAAVLGVVEGLTEYLPVSSTGHLLLVERIMGVGDSTSASLLERQRSREAADAYTICIQAGAIIAVVSLYFQRVKQMVLGLSGKDAEGCRLLINLTSGFLPAAVIGVLLNKTIKENLFGPWPVIVAWFAGGAGIFVVNRWIRKVAYSNRIGLSVDECTWRMALIIGFAQCIAMLPGVSRSLVTIVGGILAGFSLPAAVEFSFLLGIATLGAATIHDILKYGEIMLQIFDAIPMTIGILSAFLTAILSVKLTVTYLNRHGLAIFGYYRIAIALIGSMLIAVGRL